jgi:hypothetical protein
VRNKQWLLYDVAVLISFLSLKLLLGGNLIDKARGSILMLVSTVLRQ